MIEDRGENRVESTEEKIGEGVGGVTGALAGAGLGSAAGPVGTLIGGIAGAIGGWWAGEKVGRAVDDWNENEPRYRKHYDSTGTSDLEYDDARVGYSLGHIAKRNPDYAGRRFEEIEPELRNGLGKEYDRYRPYIHGAYTRN